MTDDGSAFRTHMLDQIEAGSHETYDMFMSLADVFHQAPLTSHLDSWTTSVILRATHHGRCEHLLFSAPAFILAWAKPLMLRCLDCACRIEIEQLDDDENMRCDICGEDNLTVVYTFAERVPPFFIVTGGTCEACRSIINPSLRS